MSRTTSPWHIKVIFQVTKVKNNFFHKMRWNVEKTCFHVATRSPWSVKVIFKVTKVKKQISLYAVHSYSQGKCYGVDVQRDDIFNPWLFKVSQKVEIQGHKGHKLFFSKMFSCDNKVTLTYKGHIQGHKDQKQFFLQNDETLRKHVSMWQQGHLDL